MSSIIDSYLADLDRALAGADPATRQEIVTSIREHIDERLAVLDHEATRADIDAVLADLGEPDQVAATWYDDARGDAGQAGALAAALVRSDEDRSARSTGWAMVGLCAAALVLAWLPIVGLLAAAAALVTTIAVYRRRLRGSAGSVHGIVAITIGIVAVVVSLAPVFVLWAFTGPHTSVVGTAIVG